MKHHLFVRQISAPWPQARPLVLCIWHASPAALLDRARAINLHPWSGPTCLSTLLFLRIQHFDTWDQALAPLCSTCCHAAASSVQPAIPSCCLFLSVFCSCSFRRHTQHVFPHRRAHLQLVSAHAAVAAAHAPDNPASHGRGAEASIVVARIGGQASRWRETHRDVSAAGPREGLRAADRNAATPAGAGAGAATGHG